jgi:hypothetical protein
MTNPITPPPELVQQWASEWRRSPTANRDNSIATQAAQWGSDQELEACCEWFSADVVSEVIDVVSELRAARRPKSPSLKEQALEQLACIQTDLNKFGMGISTNTIRRALEDLDD